MSTLIGIGFSKDADGPTAAQEAGDQAKYNLRHEQIDMAIVFCTPHYNPNDFIPTLHDQLKKTKLIGCSTSGIIFNGRIESQGIGILLIYSEEIRFETSCVDHLNLQDFHTAGKEFAQKGMSDFGREQRKLLLFFADGLLQDFSKGVQGMLEFYENRFPVAGIGSSDDFLYQHTYQFYNDTVLSSGICGVLLGGKLQVGASCYHGWRPLGKPHIINEHENNVIKTIDQKPAAQIYRDYFQTEEDAIKAASLKHLNIRYPLGVASGQKGNYLLRNVLKTLDDDSIVFQDSITEGKPIHLMIGNKESCLKAGVDAAIEVKQQGQRKLPRLILVFESQSRYRVLGRSASTEIQHIWNILGTDAPMFGMYSLGEFFSHPNMESPLPLMQNESIIITAIF